LKSRFKENSGFEGIGSGKVGLKRIQVLKGSGVEK
jgi:hypothetical protein